MKTIEHSYGTDLEWTKPFANKLGGKIKDNFIITPHDLFTGTRYFLDCGDDIAAYYVDVVNNIDVNMIQKNTKNDFIGIYYNLSEGQVHYSSSNFARNIGRWQYNLLVVDSALQTNYRIKAGSRSHVFCIFIKKNKLISYAEQNNIILPDLKKIIDPFKNTIIRFDRMSNESYHLIHDLNKLKMDGPIFELNIRATVHLLLSNFLKKIFSSRIITQTVNEKDLDAIIASQMYLLEHIETHFPTIEVMARKSNMSDSKFKSLFKKVTGKTPNDFFMINKLMKAKELLEEKKLTISQISDKLNFSSNSYFSSKFRAQFGISPKTFVNLL